MKPLEAHLNDIVAWHQDHGREFLKVLLPGITDTSALRKQVNLNFPESIYELYRWHNGTAYTIGSDLEDLHIIPGFFFRSFEDSVKNYQMLTDARTDETYWRASWFPILRNSSNDYYVVDCAPGAKNVGAIIAFRHDDLSRPILYGSLYDMFATFAKCMSAEAFRMENGIFCKDSILEREIARKCNPSIAYWRR